MITIRFLYFLSVAVAITLCLLTPNDDVAWALSLLSTGWVGGFTFAIMQRPRWFFRLVTRLP